MGNLLESGRTTQAEPGRLSLGNGSLWFGDLPLIAWPNISRSPPASGRPCWRRSSRSLAQRCLATRDRHPPPVTRARRRTPSTPPTRLARSNAHSPRGELLGLRRSPPCARRAEAGEETAVSRPLRVEVAVGLVGGQVADPAHQIPHRASEQAEAGTRIGGARVPDGSCAGTGRSNLPRHLHQRPKRPRLDTHRPSSTLNAQRAGISPSAPLACRSGTRSDSLGWP